jgi:tetratricopeptide (TPR) repeat protein
LLVLDDLQWAGPDALELLATLVRAAAEVPLRVIGAYRNTELRPLEPLSVLLADLAHAELAVHRQLAPLAPVEAAALLDGLLADTDATLRARILERTGGVPFFVVSCAQEWRVGDRPTERQDSVPWNVAQSVRQRVAALQEPAQEVLGVAALLGRSVEPALLLAVADHGERAVLAALDAACHARLLVEEGDRYAFAHDVIREALEAEQGAARRSVVHRSIGEALEQRGEHAVELLAYHYSHGGVQDKAVFYLEQAGDRAQAQAAYLAAAGHYQELVSYLDGLGRLPESARLREKLGGALAISASYDTALAVLDQAMETVRGTDDLESLGRIGARIGHIHYNRGTLAEGIADVEPLIERLETRGPSAALALLHTSLAELNLHSGQWAEELGAAERAGQVARLVGEERILARAEYLRGMALFLMGHEQEALPVIEAAIKVAERIGEHTSVGEALRSLASVYEARGEFQQSSRCAERALRVAERLRDPVLMASSIIHLGYIALHSGEWDRARAYYGQAQALHHQIDLSPSSCEAGALLVALGHLRQLEGAADEASCYLDQGRAIYSSQGKRSGLRWTQGLLAEGDILAGRPAAARARLLPLLDRRGLEEHHVTTDVLPVLAWAYLEVGDTEQAVQTVWDAIRRLRAAKGQFRLVDALRVQALLALREHHWEHAEAALEEGLAVARAMPYPYAEGRLLQVHGELALQRGERGPGHERLGAALAIFRRLGARKDVERTEHLLAALG